MHSTEDGIRVNRKNKRKEKGSYMDKRKRKNSQLTI